MFYVLSNKKKLRCFERVTLSSGPGEKRKTKTKEGNENTQVHAMPDRMLQAFVMCVSPMNERGVFVCMKEVGGLVDMVDAGIPKIVITFCGGR